ncbi:MAG: hypothetical protein OHK0019_38620 [Saprospiraceae bacterium]
MTKIAIFIPGMNLSRKYEQTIDGHAQRLANALEQIRPSGHRYTVKITKEKLKEDHTEDQMVAVAEIIERQNGMADVTLYRIYEFLYSDLIAERFRERAPMARAWEVFLIMAKRILGVTPFWGPMFRAKVGLSSKDKWQVAIYTITFLLVGFYILSIFPAFLSLLINSISLAGVDTDSPDGKYTNEIVQRIAHFVRSHLVWLRLNWIPVLAFTGAVYAFFPKLKESLTYLAINALSLENYFMYGEQRAAVSGKFDNLLNDILEREGSQEIEVHTFSFGGILALDALYPYENPASPLVARHIVQLITIAVPYDYIRVYYPHYFKERKSAKLALRKWYNVYSDVDVLSSNFRNDPKEEPGTQLIVPESVAPHNLRYNTIYPTALSWADWITLIGFRAHNMFWDGRYPFAHSCYQRLWQIIDEEEMKKV